MKHERNVCITQKEAYFCTLWIQWHWTFRTTPTWLSTLWISQLSGPSSPTTPMTRRQISTLIWTWFSTTASCSMVGRAHMGKSPPRWDWSLTLCIRNSLASDSFCSLLKKPYIDIVVWIFKISPAYRKHAYIALLFFCVFLLGLRPLALGKWISSFPFLYFLAPLFLLLFSIWVSCRLLRATFASPTCWFYEPSKLVAKDQPRGYDIFMGWCVPWALIEFGR